MATEKQIQANRLNAARSTGPRTPEGKATSRSNATKHGLTARQIVLAGEDQEAYDALMAGLFAQYNPEGPLQEQLIRQLADCLWRLQRVPMLEALVLETAKYGKTPDVSGAPDHHSSMRHFVIPNDVLGKLARHEAQLFKQMQSMVALLGAPKPASRREIDEGHSERPDDMAAEKKEDSDPLFSMEECARPGADEPADHEVKRALPPLDTASMPPKAGRQDTPVPPLSCSHPSATTVQGYRRTADGIVLTEPSC